MIQPEVYAIYRKLKQKVRPEKADQGYAAFRRLFAMPCLETDAILKEVLDEPFCCKLGKRREEGRKKGGGRTAEEGGGRRRSRVAGGRERVNDQREGTGGREEGQPLTHPLSQWMANKKCWEISWQPQNFRSRKIIRDSEKLRSPRRSRN
jgi:hypothetical protein